MDASIPVRAGADAQDLNHILEVEHLLHSSIYLVMGREQEADEYKGLSDVWYDLYNILMAVAGVGASLKDVMIRLQAQTTEGHNDAGQYAGSQRTPGDLIAQTLVEEGD